MKIIIILLSVMLSLLPYDARAAQNQHFTVFLKRLKAEAVAQGFAPKLVQEAFREVYAPVPAIIKADRNQPELKLTMTTYLQRVAPPARVAKAQQKYTENQAALNKAAATYGVPTRYILAFWGVETDFGRTIGSYSVVNALTTLVYEGRRAEFFKKELWEALKILQAGHVTPAELKGSWAGAMGQCQFMPSSFNRFAQDGNGDGKKDIWSSKQDVFASIANYLSSSGWEKDGSWGHAVVLPEGFDKSLIRDKTRKTRREWHAMGVRHRDGSALSGDSATLARVIQPQDDPKAAYLVFNNFDVTMKWNRSEFFAVAIGTLADQIGTR